ncbi:MAG: AAA family ATPase [Polyangiales bacterium]
MDVLPRSLRTLIAIHEDTNGACVAHPVMRPDWAAYGLRDDCVEELRLFLEAQLLELSAPDVAKLHLPPECEGRLVHVPIAREDLPHALRSEHQVVFPCALIPRGRSHWAVILPLNHAFHVEHDEPLEETIRAEARRLVHALEPTPAQWLDLLPSAVVEVEVLTLTLAERGQQRGAVANLTRRLTQQAERRAAREMLDHVGRALHGGHRPSAPFVGRRQELAGLSALLAAPRRSGVVLVGAEGTGKSALFDAWLRGVGAQEGRLVWATSGAQLIAGQSGLGQWQERLRRVLTAVEKLDAILYFDDLADLFGDKAGGFVDLASGVKPFVDDGRVRIVGELTSEVLDELRQRDPSFLALFHVISLPAMTRDETAAVLHARVEHDSRRAGNVADAPLMGPETERVILALTERFVPYRAFPGKALRLYEEVVSAARRVDPSGGTSIDAEQAYLTFSAVTGVPRFLLDPGQALGADRLRDRLRARVIGQEPAVERVLETLGVLKASLSPGEKPLASFLFVGPTGVGKTELARALAAEVFGDEAHIIRFDMSEYADPSAAERLIRGTDSREGALTREVRRKPFGVVLLDELEKADPSVFDLLLQVCGEGRLTDARGRTAYFHNVILIMTSNLGAQHRARAPLGLGARAPAADVHYDAAVEARFRPEFVNRIDRVVPFASLDTEQMRAVTRLMVRKLAQRRGFRDARATLWISTRALESMASAGHDPAYGARGMRRFLDESLAAPLARVIGELGEAWEGATLSIRLEDDSEPAKGVGASERMVAHRAGEWLIEVYRGDHGAARHDLSVIDAFSALRREAHAWMVSPAIEALTQRRRFLTMQLARRSSRQATASSASVARDIGRLEAPLSELEAAAEETRIYEELLLGSLWAGETSADIDHALARALRDRLTRAGVRASMTDEPVDRASVYVQERDAHCGAGSWLLGLLRETKERGWSVWGFPARAMTGVEVTQTPSDWGAHAFAPAHGPDELRALVEREPRAPLSLVLSLSGPLSGSYLYAERGLHRVLADADGPPRRHFSVSFVIAEAPPKQTTLARVTPAPFDPRGALHLEQAARVVDPRRGRVRVGESELEVPADAYWEHIDRIVGTVLRDAQRARAARREAETSVEGAS